MYGENGALLRAELSALLAQLRVHLRLGSGGSHPVPVTGKAERHEIGAADDRVVVPGRSRTGRSAPSVRCRPKRLPPVIARVICRPWCTSGLQHGAVGTIDHEAIHADAVHRRESGELGETASRMCLGRGTSSRRSQQDGRAAPQRVAGLRRDGRLASWASAAPRHSPWGRVPARRASASPLPCCWPPARSRRSSPAT